MTPPPPVPRAWRPMAAAMVALALAVLLRTGAARALEVELLGVSGVMAENVRGSVGLFDLPGREAVDEFVIRFYLRSIEEEVGQALQPFGFYTPSTTVRRDAPDRLTVIVDPGAPVFVSEIELSFTSGDEAWRGATALPAFPLVVGDRFDHALYERGKNALRDALYRAGHVDATPLEQRVIVDPAAHTARIRLAWDVGAQHLFGPIRFSGSQLDDDVLQRFPAHAEGDVFDSGALLTLGTRLRNSGYFGEVSVTPDLSLDEPVIPVDVTVTPAARIRYAIGLLYGTDSGGGVEGEVDLRWVNAAGHRASAEADMAQREQRIGATYEIPSNRDHDHDSVVRIAAEVSDEETDAFDTRATRLGVSRMHRWGPWRRTDTLQYLDERSDFGSTEADSSFLIPSVALSRSTQEGGTVPTRGWLLRLGARGALDGLASSTSFAQVDVSGRYVTTPAPPWRIIARGALGATWVDDFDALPASLRYFAGGDRSIRGYDFESLGPVNAQGDTVGGRFLLEASVEVERRLFGNWRIAGFVDVGNALEDPGDDLVVGAGIGARYVSPVGLVRLDLGFPLDGEEDGPRIHLVVGPDL